MTPRKIGHFWTTSPSITLGQKKEDPHSPTPSDVSIDKSTPLLPTVTLCHRMVDPVPPSCVTSFMNVPKGLCLAYNGLPMSNVLAKSNYNEIVTSVFEENQTR